jgi:ATP adenylyltransferase
VKQLFAPWRHAWVTSADAKGDPGTSAGCLFCRVWADPARDVENLVVHRGDAVFVLLNRYPYNGGHLLVAPTEHQGALQAVSAAARCEMIELAARSLEVLGAAYAPDGCNLGVNQGRAAGAGIPDHVHLHVVPRWNGDTNFLTTVGELRVISQDLGRVRDELARRFAGGGSSR